MSGFIGVNVNKMPTQHYFYQNSHNNANRSKNACSCSTSGYSSQSISECGEYPKKHQHQQQLQYVSRPPVAKKYTQADSYSMEFSTQSPSSSSSTWSCSPQQAVRTSTPTHACAINHKLNRNSNFLSSISTIASLQQQVSPPSPPRTRVLVPERVTIPSPELSVVNKSTGDSSSSSWSFFKFLLYIFSCFNIFKLFKTDADERPTVKCSTPVPLSVPMTVTGTARTIPGHHYYYDEKETYDNLPSMAMITVPQCLLATSQDSLNKAAIQHQATAATTVTTSSVLLSSPSTSISAFSSINRPQPKQQQQQPQQIVSSSPLDRYQVKSNFYNHQQHQRPKYSTQTYASSMECIVRQQPQISLICPKVTLATSPQSSNNYLSMINLHQLKPRVSSICTSASSSSSILPSLPSSQTLSVPAPFYEDYLCDKEVESYFDSSVYYSNVVDYTNEQVVLADCVNKPQFVNQHHNQITPLSMSSPSSSSSASSSSGVNSTSTSSSHYHQPTKLNERIKTPARTKTSSFITSGYIRQIQNESYC